MLRLDTFGGALAIFVLLTAAIFGGIYTLTVIFELLSGLLWWSFGL